MEVSPFIGSWRLEEEAGERGRGEGEGRVRGGERGGRDRGREGDC